MDQRELARYYTITPEEKSVIHQQRGASNRLGYAIQICYLRFPGRPLASNESIPELILHYISKQIGISPDSLKNYAGSRGGETRREHLRKIRNQFGYRAFTSKEYRELAHWLLPTAMSTNKGIILVESLVTEMRNRKVILPAIYTIEHLGWSVRERAKKLTYKQLTKGLTTEQCESLDRLLKLREGTKQSYLTWLRKPPHSLSSKSFHKILDRHDFIGQLQLPLNNGRDVHQNRLLQMAREGARYSNQHLARFQPLKRHATIMAFLMHTYAFLIDHGLDMHDKLIGKMFNRKEQKGNDDFKKDGKSINEKVRLYAQVGKALIEAKESEQDPFETIQSIISWDQFVQTVEEADQLARPIEFDFFELLDDHYNSMRKFVPRMLNTYVFKASHPSESLLQALHLLQSLNKARKRKVPEDAPIDFVKPKWQKHVFKENEIDRHYYEICVMSELRNHLRSGDMWVVGSRQYKDFEDYLLTPETWTEIKQANQIPLKIPTNVDHYLQERQEVLEAELNKVTQLIRNKELPDVTIENQKIKISELKKTVPEEAEVLLQHVYDLLPRIKLTDLLVEVDGWTHFTRHFTHLHNNSEPREKSTLFAALLADGINLGLSKMADACPGITYEQLAWVADWYIREETYSKAQAELVDFHHTHPFSIYFGDGTTSSSDGQDFRAGHQARSSAQVNTHYGSDPRIKFYSHLSDQYSPFFVKVISSAEKEAPHIIDGLLNHETELKIEEHYTDTAGFVDHIFAMCHLFGFRFAPRVKSLGTNKIYAFHKPRQYAELSFLMSNQKIKPKPIKENWDHLLHLTSSVARGTVTASLILKKLSSYPRQNGLSMALREVGRIEHSLHILNWIQDPAFRKRVQIGLNKGESANALKRAVASNRLGEIRDRSYEDQSHRASGIQLVVSAIILWNTVYIAQAVDTLRAKGIDIPEEYLKHLSPLGWEHVNLTGDYIWNLKQRVPLDNLRPLREKRFQ
ncbi:Tn3 family transposase [Shimazuella alba]|uniref:Tn3 family transposase n=1 Tax=Shimazuella alba TaxID=2690964 RepID=UPI003B831C83